MRTLPAARTLARLAGALPVAAAVAVLLAGRFAPMHAAAQVVTFESTVEQLRDPDPGVRRSAMRLLTDARYPEAAVPMAALIRDEDETLQVEAMAAQLHLFLVEPPAARRRVGLVFEQRGPAPAETFFAQGPLALGAGPVPDAVFEALLDAARDDNGRVGLEAMYTLGVLSPGGSSASPWRTRAAAGIAAHVTHDEREHRRAAVRVLGRVFAPAPGRTTDDRVGQAVIAALGDRQEPVRIAAMQALAALRETRAVTALMERFARDRRGREGDAALAALAAIGHPSAAPIFIDQLAAGSVERKRLAVEGLARTGPPAILGDLRTRLARDTDRTLALAMAFAAARLGDGPVDAIISGLVQPGLDAQAFGYLAELVGPRQKLLAVYVRDPEVRVRTLLADAVAIAGDLQALPLVEGLLRDSDPAVAAAATRAVTWLQARR